MSDFTLNAETILLMAATAIWVVAGWKLSIVDIKTKRLPTKIIWPTLAVVVVLYIVTSVVARDVTSLGWAAAGGIGPFAFFYALYLINPRWMGGGDVRLAALNGFLVGWYGPAQPWYALVAAVILAFPAAFILVVIKGPKSGLSFGPFMVLGTAIMVGLEISGISPFSS